MANKLQNTILIIANEIDRICKEYNIEYFMEAGTLLGAIRHKGFIPWDDDFDIGMRRSEYERFISVCDNALDQSIFTLETSSTPEYAFAFAKIHLNGTNVSEDFSKNVNVHHGIFVDIFPFDNIPDNPIVRRLFLANNHILKNIIWIKCNYGTDQQKKRMTYKCLKLIGYLFSVEKLKKTREIIVKKYNCSNTLQCFTSDYPNFHINNEWINTIALYDFEGYKYPGFSSYHDYLTYLYGDYMVLPKTEDRKTHTTHLVDFGNY